MSLKLDTPSNILEMSEEEVMALCEVGEGIPIPMDRRFFIAKNLFRAMKLDLTADIALAILSNPRHKMIIAGAGAGKSTVIHANILKTKSEYFLTTGKMLPGNRILFLAFGENNVTDMKATHATLASNIKKSGIKGIKVDDRIDARTFHAFCKSWFDEYLEYLGLESAYLETDDYVYEERLERLLPLVRKKHEVSEEVNFRDMLTLYRNAQESMIPFDSDKIYDLYPNLPCSLEALKAWFNALTNVKKSLKIYDFTDIVVGFNRLTRENQRFLDRLKVNFHEINLDECQDFNPIMIDSVRNMSKHLKVTMIGDEDQLIFRFRGADPDLMGKFRDNFEDSRVYSMMFNRRCRAKICELALNIVQRNEKRFDKVILPMKPGGEVIMKGYSTEEGQLLQLVNHLKSKAPEDLSKVGIACKENIHTSVLTYKLEEAGIPHNIKKGNAPYSHRIFDNYVNLLSLLESPFDPYLKRELFKVLPITKAELATVLETPNGDLDFDIARKHFCEIDYGSLESKEGFREGLKNLETMSTMARNEPVRNYIVGLTNMFYAYYWNFQLKLVSEDAKRFYVDRYFTDIAFEFFNSPMMVRPLLLKLAKRKETLENYSASGIGVSVGTLHSFKGLEAEEFHITYMDADVFPSIEAHGRLSQEALQELYESETSLAYVGFSRAKDVLYLHYNLERPSIYISQAQEFLKTYVEKEINIPKLELSAKPKETPKPKQVIVKPTQGTSEEKTPAIASFDIPDEIKVQTKTSEAVYQKPKDITLEPELEFELDLDIPTVSEPENVEPMRSESGDKESVQQEVTKEEEEEEEEEKVKEKEPDTSSPENKEGNKISINKGKSKVSSFMDTFKI